MQVPTLAKPRTLLISSRSPALQPRRPFGRGPQAGAACRPRPACAQASQQRREGLAARAPARLLAGLAAGGWLVRPPAVPAEEAAGAAQPAAEQLGAASDAVLAAAAAQAGNGFSDSDNLIISVLFTVAIAALTVLTLGVAYLSYGSWQDSRAEAEDRKRAGGLGPVASGSGGAQSAKKAKKEKQPEEAASFKGFGKKK